MMVPWRMALFFLALLGCADAAGGVSFAEPWYKHIWEYQLVESLVLIPLILLAIFFELLSHHVVHKSTETFCYGEGSRGLPKLRKDSKASEDPQMRRLTTREIDSKGCPSHTLLFRDLADRASGEFMTLGFLAFLVFVARKLRFFKWLAGAAQADHIALPRSEGEWVEVVEMVHMEIFVGMLAYFFLVMQIVRGSNRAMAKDEKSTVRARALRQHDEETLMGWAHVHDRDLEKFLLRKQYFIENFCHWKHTSPELFATLLESLAISPESEDAEQRARAALTDCCDISSYVALCMEDIVMEAIEVSVPMWTGILVVVGSCAFLTHFLHSEVVSYVAIICLVFTCVILGAMVAVKKTFSKNVQNKIIITGGTFERLSSWFFKPVTVMRITCTMLFLLSYSFGENVLYVWGWKTNPIKVLMVSLIQLSVFLLLSHFLPVLVPPYLASMSVPPFMSADNLAFLAPLLIWDGSDSAVDEKPSLKDIGNHTSVMPTTEEHPSLTDAQKRRILKGLQARLHVVLTSLDIEI
eukprot:TRINITY_DN10488_c0_g2_i1.p1 TRINITY_DN10488_c0_g2~~TRINITY_DN10488_c0_g2_i1.p1  ORF type:complete len:524 (-),score=62.60 TRINITY_DN10488_c0_g2_i1:76-1647(-)